MTIDLFYHLCGIVVLASPMLLVGALGIPPLLGLRLREKTIDQFTYATVLCGLIAAVLVLAGMLITGSREVNIELGKWIDLEEINFHFHLKFVFDRLSVPFVILTYLLCGTVGAFTSRYLHREAGYSRFYIAYSIFMFGMVVATLAGTIEALFFGWEAVGLSSALLIAFFQERKSPVKNGLRAWSIYRVADAAFLIAAIWLHHMHGEGDFSVLMGNGSWPEGQASLQVSQAIPVGLLLIIAAAGKSALIPFSGWLPRAMEGPTSSSAIFYGALSVHLGAYLLLRISPILELSLWLSGTVVVLGLSTALFAALAGRVQADVKTALAYASLTQVGIIVAEIGFGFRYIALVHILGHAALRTLQLLRAPTLLHDYRVLENALGGRQLSSPSLLARWVPLSFQRWLYLFSLERGHLDAILDRFVVRPFLVAFRYFDLWERRWTAFLSRESNVKTRNNPAQRSLEITAISAAETSMPSIDPGDNFVPSTIGTAVAKELKH